MAKLALQTSSGPAAQAAVDLDTLVRSILFVSVFLAALISFHPFQSLAEPPAAVSKAAIS